MLRQGWRRRIAPSCSGRALLWGGIRFAQLYALKLTLCDGTKSERGAEYFGMRSRGGTGEESNAPANLCLNGEPIYSPGALYQSYHVGAIILGVIRSVTRDIAYAKRAALICFSIHIKVDDHCCSITRTIGMLLMCDFPEFRGRRRYRNRQGVV